jgi:hypothetical protein
MFADHVKLGRDFCQASIIHCLVGCAMQSGAAWSFYRLLPALHAQQDARIVREVTALLAIRPDFSSMASGWTKETENAVLHPEALNAGVADKWDDYGKAAGDEIRRQAREKADWARTHSDEVRKSLAYVRDLHDAWAREARKPRWLRVFPGLPAPVDNDITREAMSGLRTCWDVPDKCDRSDACLKLIAVHAAIRQYRHEHHALPNSLQDLGLGDLITDPFTGNPLTYRPSAGTYALYSIGVNGKDDGGRDQRDNGDDIRLDPRH